MVGKITLREKGSSSSNNSDGKKKSQGDTDRVTANAVKIGIIAGMAVAGTEKALSFISDTLLGFAPVVATMKLLKAIILLLLMPLVPILKPVLIALGAMAKLMVGAGGLVQAIATIAGIVTIISAFIAGLGAIPALLIGLVAALLIYLAAAFGTWLRSVFSPEKVWGLMVAGWKILKTVGQWLWDQIIKPAFDFLSQVGQWIWEQILKPAFNYLLSAGEWIWSIVKAPFTYLSDMGQWIWSIIKAPFQWLVDKIKSMLSVIGVGSNNNNTNSNSRSSNTKKNIGLGDGIITPNGIISTHPDDYIIATKTPGSLGGGGVVNINIDKPTFSSETDMRKLVQMISAALQKENRRYSSYV
jgi:hypothetical protein